MVLQRDVPAKISGWADEGEVVVVKLDNQVVRKAVGAGPEKAWTVTLPMLHAGQVPDLAFEGKNTVTLTNLLAGDVWICSGQSNMEMGLQAGPWCRYGDVVAAGPKPSQTRFGPGQVIIAIDPGGQEQQLVFRPGAGSGFEVAGADGAFVSATVELQGSTTIVAAASVPQPLSIRYGWKDNPTATLFNTAGLRAAPFQIESAGSAK